MTGSRASTAKCWPVRASGSSPSAREAFLAILQFQEHLVAAPWRHRRAPDEDDVVFLEVAAQTRARTVVTGNLKHFPPRCRGPVAVLSPRAAGNAWSRSNSPESGHAAEGGPTSRNSATTGPWSLVPISRCE